MSYCPERWKLYRAWVDEYAKRPADNRAIYDTRIALEEHHRDCEICKRHVAGMVGTVVPHVDK